MFIQKKLYMFLIKALRAILTTKFRLNINKLFRILYSRETLSFKMLFSHKKIYLKAHQNAPQIPNQCTKTFHFSYEPHMCDLFHLKKTLNRLNNSISVS